MDIITCQDNAGFCAIFNWLFKTTLYVYALSLPAFLAIKLANRS